jgi:ABC-type transport system involved in multi-copper enzyme maturation permease subunit
VSAFGVLVGWAVREAVRRRVFLVVGILTLGYLALFFLGTRVAFRSLGDDGANGVPVDTHDLAGATLTGLAMFAVLFLGSVLAVFLGVAAFRGDAESGLLQPIVTRPVGRGVVVLSRAAAAAVVSGAYVAVVFALSLLVVRVNGSWSPASPVGPGARLVAAVVVVSALCVLGSTVLSTVANGIATFMVFGAGLFAGLMGQVARGIGSTTLQHVATGVSWGLPFEALYQDGLAALGSQQNGLTRTLVQLGPFGGGAPASVWLWAYLLGYLALVLGGAVAVARRRDL